MANYDDNGLTAAFKVVYKTKLHTDLITKIANAVSETSDLGKACDLAKENNANKICKRGLDLEIYPYPTQKKLYGEVRIWWLVEKKKVVVKLSDHKVESYEDSIQARIPRDNLNELIEYVRSLELSDEKDETAKVSAVDGMLTMFDNLNGQHLNDVENSMLLAQLAANKQQDRFSNPVSWYKVYTNVLENIGWGITGFEFMKFDSHSETFRMDKAVLGVLKSLLSENGYAIATSTINALGKLSSNSDGLRLFEDSSSSVKEGNFQIGFISAHDGNVMMALSANHFTMQTHEEGFLWWTWNSEDITLYMASQSVILDENIYAQIREEIVEKLGEKAKKFIKDISI